MALKTHYFMNKKIKNIVKLAYAFESAAQALQVYEISELNGTNIGKALGTVESAPQNWEEAANKAAIKFFNAERAQRIAGGTKSGAFATLLNGNWGKTFYIE